MKGPVQLDLIPLQVGDKVHVADHNGVWTVIAEARSSTDERNLEVVHNRNGRQRVFRVSTMRRV